MADNNVVAPMIGKVIKVLVKPGDTIKENDPVIMLEAMKMEMPVTATASGTIKEVKVEVEQTVEGDTILAIIES